MTLLRSGASLREMIETGFARRSGRLFWRGFILKTSTAHSKRTANINTNILPRPRGGEESRAEATSELCGGPQATLNLSLLQFGALPLHKQIVIEILSRSIGLASG